MRIETPRLVIRSFEEADVPAYAAIVADPEVTRYLGDGAPHSYEEARGYVLDCIARDRATGVSRYAVTCKRNSALLGFCGFKALAGYVDFGWRYARHVWGRGVATEAALAVLDHGVQTLQLDNLAAGTFVENAASLAIIRKLGFPHVETAELQGRETARYHQSPGTLP